MLTNKITIGVAHNNQNDIKICETWLKHFYVLETENSVDFLIKEIANKDSEYYGIMSGGVYFSFNDIEKSRVIDYMQSDFAEQYGYKIETIENEVSGFSLITYDAKNIRNDKFRCTPPATLYKFYEDKLKNFIPSKILYVFELYIKSKHNELAMSYDSYMNGTMYYNSLNFVMRKDTFNYFLHVLSGALEEINKSLDIMISHISAKYKDCIANILLGVFVCYFKLTDQKELKILNHVKVINTTSTDIIYPAFDDNNVTVVTVSSNYYVPYLSVWLKSFLSHTTDANNYDFIVFESEITEYNKKVLKDMIKGIDNISLRFVNPKPLLNGATFFVANSSYCQEAYYRVFAPWILNRHQKIIIMDCDIVAESDIAELYNQDYDECYIGAVKDIVYQGLITGDADRMNYTKYEMGMINPYDYINTGVMVMNLEKIRQFYLLEYFIDFCKTHKFKIQEQDALNVLFEGRITEIDLRWNYYVNMNKWITNCLNVAPIEARKYYDECCDSPKLIHYANKPKPWIDPNICYANNFWHYAKQTPFYEVILLRMVQDKRNIKSVSESAISSPKISFKQKVKENVIKPIIKPLLPVHSIRREYYKELVKKLSRKPNRFDTVKYFKKQYSLLRRNKLSAKLPFTIAWQNKQKMLELRGKYKGKRCFFIGLGPSLRISDLEKITNEVTFAVNNIFSLYEKTHWRPTFYLNQETIAQNSDYIYNASRKNYKLCDPSISFFPLNKHSKDIYKYVKNAIFLPIVNDWTMYYGGSVELDTFSEDCASEIHGAFVSMYSCLQIAAYLGFEEVILIGCDGKYTLENPHCYKRNELDDKIIINEKSAAVHTAGINKGFVAMKKAADRLGIRIYNATRGGFLEVFPRIKFDDVVK